MIYKIELKLTKWNSLKQILSKADNSSWPTHPLGPSLAPLIADQGIVAGLATQNDSFRRNRGRIRHETNFWVMVQADGRW
jgi:hypothetical protein